MNRNTAIVQRLRAEFTPVHLSHGTNNAIMDLDGIGKEYDPIGRAYVHFQALSLITKNTTKDNN